MPNRYEKFLLDSGLYDEDIMDYEHEAEFVELISGKVKLDCYCPKCNAKRVFSIMPVYYYDASQNKAVNLSEELEGDRHKARFLSVSRPDKPPEKTKPIYENNLPKQMLRCFVLTYTCGMNEAHTLDFCLTVRDGKIKKIGQYPSTADLAFPELNEYKHVITAQDRKELGTALGLYANGVGVGSYVYLRRILERLVYQAKEKAGESVDNNDFQNAKVADRIKMLKGFLPDTLVQNTTVYGILSKGIHELSEEDCIKFFPVVQRCIYMILGMWEDQRKKQADEDAMNKALSAITSSI